MAFRQGGQVDLAPDLAQQLQAITQGLYSIQSANQHQIGPHGTIPVPHTAFPPHPPGQGIPGIGDPGPSSHPRGPPNLGQLSAAAAAAVQTPAMPPGPPVQEDEEANKDSDDGDKSKGASTSGTGSGRTRGNRTAAMGTDEWARQRKDNHVRCSIHDLNPGAYSPDEPRKKLNADEGVTLTKESTSLVALCRIAPGRRPKERSSLEPCSTFIISRKTKRVILRNGHWKSY